MKLANLLAIAAAASLAASPALAATPAATKSAVHPVRLALANSARVNTAFAAADESGGGDGDGGAHHGTHWLPYILTGLIVAGVIAVIATDNSSSPKTPASP